MVPAELADSIERLAACVERLAAKVDALEHRLAGVAQSTARMDDHISFVESVYATVKSPFHYLMSSVDLLRRPMLLPAEHSALKAEQSEPRGN